MPESVVQRDAANFNSDPQFRDLNPYLAISSRITELLLENRRAVLTAHQNGGPVEVFVDGIAVDGSSTGMSEKSVAVAINSLLGKSRLTAQKADDIAKKIVREGKEVVIEVKHGV